MKKTALVIGATGVSGRAMIDHLDGKPDWDVIGVSRKPPYFKSGARFVHADLMDPQNCADNFGGLKEIAHVFYCAYLDNKNISETRVPNTKMFANVLPVIEKAAPNLQHCPSSGFLGQ